MRKIFHLHLPKTGGMALQAFLVEQLGRARVSPSLGGVKLTDALLQWQNIQAISGHFVAKQGDTLPLDRLCMTVLRNPFERFVSEFNYNKHDVDSLLLDTKRFTHDLDAYCDSLSHAAIEKSSVQMGMLYPLGTDAQTRLTADEMLSAACKALDQFEMVGITEALDDFVAMLTATMDWPYQPLHRVNVASHPAQADTLTEAQRTTIAHLIEPELELYRHALSRFQRDRRGWIGRGKATVVSGPNPGSNAVDTAAHASKPVEPINFGDLRCEIISVSVAGSISGYQQVMAGELMNITIEFAANQAVEQLNVGIAIKDERGMLMYGSNTLLHGSQYTLTTGRYAATFTMINRLGPGRYELDVALMPGESHYDGCYHWKGQIASIVVDAYAIQHYEGRVLMDAEVRIDGTSPDATWERQSVLPPGAAVRSFGRQNEPLRDFTATIEPMVRVDVMPIAADSLVQVRLTNNGMETWPSTGRNPVHLSYRWRSPESGEIMVADGLRTVLREDMLPGASQMIALQVRAPKEAGLYLLDVSLVQEQVAWFCDRLPGSACPLRIEIR